MARFKVLVERETWAQPAEGPAVWEEVYVQTVEGLDLQAVIRAVNGLESPPAPVRRHRRKETPGA